MTPTPNSVIDMLLRATNKETGRGLTDVQIAAQANTLIAGERPPVPLGSPPWQGGQRGASWLPCAARTLCPLLSCYVRLPTLPCPHVPRAAGYETSANALAFAIYCLASQPEAEAALLAEVDALEGQVRRP